MFWKKKEPGHSALVEIEPVEASARLARGEIVLVDVREHHEIAAEWIPGALAMPLSQFDPANLPDGEVVLSCLGGKRSAAALARCREAGVAVNTHMRGGLMAWKAAGLPTGRD
ncbi:MAG: rhodanese-like domain-containing protein [Beijerinckiaceae bacterium]|nr:rhodanese-like domain-containing protein [Beijerinckiaceae bacterium]